MRLKRQTLDEKLEIQMTPMIDCVFFMVSSTFYRQEADISFALPGLAEQSEAVEIPDEQVIEITDTGRILLNDLEYDSVGDSDLPELVRTLTRFRESADASKTPALITIAPADPVKQQRVVDVLNACAAARVQNVTFAVEEEGP